MSELPADYPAAHSMDSEWFAVDAYGHIGYFDTRSEGAKPKWGWVGQGILEEFTRRMVEAGALYYLEDILKSPDGKIYRTCNPDDRDWADSYAITDFNKCTLNTRSDWEGGANEIYSTLLWLNDTSILREMEFSEFKSLNVPGHIAVYADTSSILKLDLLQQRKIILKGWLLYDLEPWRFGLFSYENKDCGSDPYVRVKQPVTPVNIHELTDEMRTKLAQWVFDKVTFEREAHLRPELHTPCELWSDRLKK